MVPSVLALGYKMSPKALGDNEYGQANNYGTEQFHFLQARGNSFCASRRNHDVPAAEQTEQAATHEHLRRVLEMRLDVNRADESQQDAETQEHETN